MAPEPRPEQDRPEAQAESAPAPEGRAGAAPARDGRRALGEAYTPKPEFAGRPSRWRWWAAGALLALSLGLGWLKLHKAPPPAQPDLVPLEAVSRP